jgi:hypothetical protein
MAECSFHAALHSLPRRAFTLPWNGSVAICVMTRAAPIRAATVRERWLWDT